MSAQIPMRIKRITSSITEPQTMNTNTVMITGSAGIAERFLSDFFTFPRDSTFRWNALFATEIRCFGGIVLERFKVSSVYSNFCMQILNVSKFLKFD